MISNRELFLRHLGQTSPEPMGLEIVRAKGVFLYDKDGNLNEWWTEEDAKRFKEKTQILVNQYNNYVVLDSLHINGQLTLGENIADNGGLFIAHNALMMAYEKNGTPEPVDSLTYDQRFLISYAQVWRQNIRPKELMRRLKKMCILPAKPA